MLRVDGSNDKIEFDPIGEMVEVEGDEQKFELSAIMIDFLVELEDVLKFFDDLMLYDLQIAPLVPVLYLLLGLYHSNHTLF